MIALDYRVVPVEDIKLNTYEVANRLNVAKDFELKEAEECLTALKGVAVCKFSAARVPIIRLGENRLNCGFGEFESKALLKNLKDSMEVFVFAVTLGHGVDRLLSRLSAVSQAKHFITDALASALAEASAERAVELIRGKEQCRPRFSPGFADLDLSLQPRILEMLNAQRLLGITVNESLLMLPVKSVTAIMGIK